MSARVTAETDPPIGPLQSFAPQAASSGVAAIALDPDDRFGGNALPNDHPHWMRDTLSISQRARALLQKFKPVVVRVMTAWDHRVRRLAIGGRTLRVDVSGSYRFD